MVMYTKVHTHTITHSHHPHSITDGPCAGGSTHTDPAIETSERICIRELPSWFLSAADLAKKNDRKLKKEKEEGSIIRPVLEPD